MVHLETSFWRAWQYYNSRYRELTEKHWRRPFLLNWVPQIYWPFICGKISRSLQVNAHSHNADLQAVPIAQVLSEYEVNVAKLLST